MKKKVFAVLAATLACSTFALSACSAKDSKIVFKHYWNYNPEPSISEEIHEELKYDVSFIPDNSGINYTLIYDGEYVTTLDSNKDGTYTFTSKLNVNATFITANGMMSETKEDYMTSEVTFHKAGGELNLRPISSKKTILSHTPLPRDDAAVPGDCYATYYYEIMTDYVDDFKNFTGTGRCLSVRKLVNEIDNEPIDESAYAQFYTFGATNSKISVLDNEQFPVAFRAMPAGTNTNVQMFNPYLGYSQEYTVSLSSDTQTQFFAYNLNGNDVVLPMAYHKASIIVDSKASGTAQTAEIATMQYGMNTYRNVMLRYYAPLSNNMGVLVYTLKSAKH